MRWILLFALTSMASYSQETLEAPATAVDSSSVYELISTQFPEWVFSFKQTNPEFDPSSFAITNEPHYWNNLSEYPLSVPLKMTERDSIFYEYSPDSSRFIDINAFAEIVESKNKEKQLAFDIDASVRVGDISREVVYQIDASGAQTGFIEAKWIDNNRILLIGHDYTEHYPNCLPFFKLYDIRNRQTVKFIAIKSFPCTRKPYMTEIDKRIKQKGLLR